MSKNTKMSAHEACKKFIRPVLWNIVVEVLEPEKTYNYGGTEVSYKERKTAGGIFIPDENLDKLREREGVANTFCKVISIADECFTRMGNSQTPVKNPIKVGDIIGIAPFAGRAIHGVHRQTTNLRRIVDEDVLFVVDDFEGLIKASMEDFDDKNLDK